MRGAAVFLGLSMLLPLVGHADLPKVQPRTHAEFMKGCREATEIELSAPLDAMLRATSCFEYVRGVMDGLVVAGPIRAKDFSICEMGKTPVIKVIRRMVSTEIDNPDEAKDMTDRLAVMIALSQLSPCK
jgi:hypothetical protein